MKYLSVFGLFIITLICSFLIIDANAQNNVKNNQNTVTSELIKIDHKNDFIFLNTIDGKLYAIGKHDGKIKWSIKEDAVLNFPKDYENPYFLTDPRDGSLYIFTNKKDGLKKFPYTIAELVSASPSKSADGFLYTGDKKDQWLAIDYRNGNKLDTLTAETFSSKVSNADENVLFIGRTKYTISMFDVNTRKKIFNLTYYDYSTHSAKINNDKQANEYESAYKYPNYHFSSSSDGTLVTLDKKNGELRWALKLENPIVAMYRYENEQLFKISFSIYSIEALTFLSKKPNRLKLLYKQQKHNELISTDKQSKPSNHKPSKINNMFSETLYIGFYNKNLYALPSFVGNWQVPLIEGPIGFDGNSDNRIIPSPFGIGNDDLENDTLIDFINTNKEDIFDWIDDDNNSLNEEDPTSLSDKAIVGHHKLPDDFEAPPDYIQPNDKIFVISNNKDSQNENLAYLQELFNIKNPPICQVDEGKKHTNNSEKFNFWKKFDQLMQNKYVWSIFTVFLASLFPIAKTIYDYKKKKARQTLKQQMQIQMQRQYQADLSTSTSDDDDISVKKTVEFVLNSSRHSSGSKNKQRKHSKSSRTDNQSEDISNELDEPTKINKNLIKNAIHASYSLPEISSDGLVKIGKVTYDPKQVLGHGCAGTFVYKGTFENRPVAVKRLLPECYTLADREVELLRDADQHQNVLRYFCTESDSQFRYIALELCQMTLHEYINNGLNSLRPLSILEQATRGLEHLHALDIVHRDIKPQNVLISFPDQKGNVSVMISDFGLCKRLETGINSFSKRSGITGTDGWIAPELIDDVYINNGRQDETGENKDNSQADSNTQSGGNNPSVLKRVTKNVDIFSLGCVYYFVLSGGAHPFGDSIRRQLNILSNEYKLDKLLSGLFSEVHMQRILIDQLISNEPKKRPSTKEILAHPVFWSKSKTLQFLQDVSDRIEKIEPDDIIITELERNANVAIKNNWKCHICAQLQADLKKFRSYNGVSVRDLLRAIRNKKHHYRELPSEVKQSLGSLPDEFVDYFTTRFPKLIMHVYDAMRCCAEEPMLDVYYKLTSS